MLSVRMLGGYEIVLNGERIDIPSHPAQSLLAFLLLNANLDHPREKLACMFWPDTATVHARGNLRNALWRIRKALATAHSFNYIHSDDFIVRLNLESSDWIDVKELVVLNGFTADLLQQTSLYQGELLPGFYDEWVILERERLQILFTHKMDLLLQQLIREQSWEQVRQQSQAWISMENTQELPYRFLMLALAAQQNPNAAVSVFHRCEDVLLNEIGLEPSAATLSLYRGILADQPLSELIKIALVDSSQGSGQDRLEAATHLDNGEPDPGAPPYMGLAAYSEEDAPLFFGRSALTEKLLNRITGNEDLQCNFLGIVGASGSGKSSLLRAGLVPALRRSTWKGKNKSFVVLTPTAHPLENLASLLPGVQPTQVQALAARLADSPIALQEWLSQADVRPSRKPSASFFIIVDQFEEVFTLCQDESIRLAFIENLLQVCGGQASVPSKRSVCVILALRADYYAQCGRYAALREALARNQEYIGRMNASELREAIEKPAAYGRWKFEAGLVDLILRDVGQEAGRLPLLSHALLETWKRRNGRLLTIAGYAAVGGIHTAIARSAEIVFQTLSPRQQNLARTVFLRLVEIGWTDEEEVLGPSTRRRANMDELRSLAVRDPAQRDELTYVINLLVDARLVTVGQETVEVSHEALIHEWPTLRQWLSENREGLLMQQHLIRSAQNWEASGREAGELYRGLRLQQALEWANLHSEDLTEFEWEFIRASQAEADRQNQEREQARQRQFVLEHRARRRLQIIVGVLLTAISVTAVLLGLLYNQQHQAKRQVGIGLATIALQQKETNPELAILLAVEALEAYPYTSQAHQALAELSQGVLPLKAIDWEENGIKYPGCQAWSLDGSQIACFSGQTTEQARVHIIDTTVLNIIRTFPVPANANGMAAFAPDGRRLLVQTIINQDINDLLVIDLSDGSQNLIQTGTKYPGAFGWAANGQQVYGVSSEAVLFWDAASGVQVGQILPEGTASFQVKIDSRPMEPWNFIEISSDGLWVAVSMADGTVQVFEFESKQLAYTLGTPSESEGGMGAHSLHWSPDSRELSVLYSLEGYNTAAMVLVWDIASRTVRYSISGSDILMHSWLPDQKGLLIFKTGSLVVWDAFGPRLQVPFPFAFAIPAPDGSGMLESGRIWDLSLLPELYVRDGSNQVYWTQDEQRWVTNYRIYETSQSEPAWTHSVPGKVSPWSPDGTRFVLYPGWEIPPTVVDGQTGSTLVTLELEALTCPVQNDYKDCLSLDYFQWLPDGRHIAAVNTGAGDHPPALYIWDAASGRQVARTEGLCPNSSFSLSASGAQIAVACYLEPDPDPAQGLPVQVPVQVWYLTEGGTFEQETPQELISAGETPQKTAWSLDGSRLAVGYASGQVILWDTAAGTATAGTAALTFAGHSREISSLSWSPDGRYLLSVAAWHGEPARALVWSASTGEIVQSLALDCGMVSRCTGNWASDGQHLMFNNLLVYHAWTDHAQLLSYVRQNFAPRELTPAERDLYGLPQK